MRFSFFSNRSVMGQVLLLLVLLSAISVIVYVSVFQSSKHMMLAFALVFEVVKMGLILLGMAVIFKKEWLQPIRGTTKRLNTILEKDIKFQDHTSHFRTLNSDLDELNQAIEQVNTKFIELKRSAYEKSEDLARQKKIAIQSAKLASLGEMAGGIAHELNNPLQVIQGQADLLLLNMDEDDAAWLKTPAGIKRARSSLQGIISCCDRISKITRSLLHFARNSDGGASDIALNVFIEEVLAISQIRVRKFGIRFDVDWEQQPEYIHCNDVQIGQVLINLINNAIDYLVEEQVSEPWIKLTISHDEQRVFLKVSNNGGKIVDEVAEKMFDAFFTTKRVGKGTGLGLSMSLGIARRHGGNLTLDRNAAFTTFVLSLPFEKQRLLA